MATMLLLLLTLTLGLAQAGQLFFEVQQQQQHPSDSTLCPDQASKCPNTATCCQMSSGEWGCCPFARAICCADKAHCCPNGYSCNAAKEECVRAINNDTIPWAEKQSAPNSVSSSSKAANPSNSITCPDSVSVCPGTAACCRTYSNAFRCCNYPNDVCCSDGNSCCPRSTICDQLNGKCISGFATEKWETMSASTPATLSSETTPAAQKLPAIVAAANGEEKTTQSPVNVVWCDSAHYCRDGQTCCRQPGGKWGCCPYIFATCCYGSIYCCQFGKRCSFPPGRCY